MRLKNSSKYLVLDSAGDTDWWSWTVYIDDLTQGELDSIKYVEYYLHPSFKNPIKRSRSSRDNFSITAKGWGTFEIKARVKYKNKKPDIVLTHLLEFESKE